MEATSAESGKTHDAFRDVEVVAYAPTVSTADTLGLCWRDTLTLSVPPTALNRQAYLYSWSVTPNDGHITFAATNGTTSAYQIWAYTAGLANPVQGYTFSCTVTSKATGATIAEPKSLQLSLFTAGFIGAGAPTACAAMHPGYIRGN